MKKLVNDLNLMITNTEDKGVLLLLPEKTHLIHQLDQSIATPSTVSALSSVGNLEQVSQYALGIILFATDHLAKPNALTIISRLKTLHCKHLLVATQQNYWQKTDFYSLGMTHLNYYAPDIDIYEFNLYSYKNVPDWLNSKLWANPKMWDKYRW